jgi:SAM-dependent methyltransferase
VSSALSRIWRAPAVQALLLQCGALLPTAALGWLLAQGPDGVSWLALALIQGVLAAAASWWRRLAPWWRPIQLLFPLALLGTLRLALPPSVFLLAFLFLLAWYWSTFRTQVPYYPSNRRVWDAVARLLPPGRPLYVIDIGSGLGGLVLELARRRPESTVVGIELAPLPWLISRLRARLGQSAARFVRGDYERLDFSQYDAVFAYLSPAVMAALWHKAAREMKPGAMLLSYEFDIAERAPDRVVAPDAGAAALYVWQF